MNGKADKTGVQENMNNLKFLPVFALVALILGIWALIHYAQGHDILLLFVVIAFLLAALFIGIASFLLHRLHPR